MARAIASVAARRPTARRGFLLGLRQHANPVEALERPQLIFPREPPEHPAPYRDVAEASGQQVASAGSPANQSKSLKHHGDLTRLTPAKHRSFRPQRADAATRSANKLGYTAKERRFACATELRRTRPHGYRGLPRVTACSDYASKLTGAHTSITVSTHSPLIKNGNNNQESLG